MHTYQKTSGLIPLELIDFRVKIFTLSMFFTTEDNDHGVQMSM